MLFADKMIELLVVEIKPFERFIPIPVELLTEPAEEIEELPVEFTLAAYRISIPVLAEPVESEFPNIVTIPSMLEIEELCKSVPTAEELPLVAVPVSVIDPLLLSITEPIPSMNSPIVSVVVPDELPVMFMEPFPVEISVKEWTATP
jgi:hypothetical protein